MIVCKELDKTFLSKQEMFKALKKNKANIIDMKKSQILKSCDKNAGVKVYSITPKTIGENNKNLELDDNFYYIATNTTKILDSHSDVHLNGIWSKTVKEQQGNNYLVLDHELKVSSTAVRKEDIEMFVAEIPFSMVGKSHEGTTEALIYKFSKDKVINETAKEWLESGNDIEASVRMQYVKMDLAMNSDAKEDEEEKKTFDKYISVIANKEDFDEIDYFWAIHEAKNVRESSLVLAGSNPATGAMNNTEPSKDTQQKEEADTSVTSLDTFYKHLKIH